MSRANEPKLPSPQKRHWGYVPYLYSVIGLGGISILYAGWQLLQQGTEHYWIIPVALTVVTSAFSINIPAVNSKISIGDTLYFTNVLLFGPSAGVITAAVDGFVGSLRSRTRSRRVQYTLFNVGAMATAAIAGGTIFFRLIGRGPLYGATPDSVTQMIFPIGVLAFMHYFLNSGTVALIIALEMRKNVYEIWKDSFLWTSITYFAGALAATLIVYAAGSVTLQAIGIAVPVLLAVHYTYKTYLNKVQEVRSLAYYDCLTSLPNRMQFKAQLTEAIAAAQQNGRIAAVMFLDLDDFKRINDTYGHSVGDLLIKTVGARLTTSVRKERRDTHPNPDGSEIVIGRFGGDEFTVLLNGISSPEEAAKIADRLLRALSAPFSLEGQDVSVGASIGISVYPSDGSDADTLLKNADTAMYHAKANGKSGSCFYAQSMNELLTERMAFENELGRALAQGELRVYYQPKADASTGLLTGAEALVRWQHPSRGILPAAAFISVAEESGLVKPMGEWVLRAVCKQVVRWQRDGLSPVPVAVNLSAAQFKQDKLTRSIAGIVGEADMDARLLELEITESAIMANEEEAGRSLRELRDLGVSLSIDDFGTGYSSLSRLKHFPLDALKIDRSFVMDLEKSSENGAIITAIIAMASSLGLKVIAEGVETEGQLQFLQAQGCDELQGWLPGRPMPADEFARLLGKRHAEPLFQTNSPSPRRVAVGDRGCKGEDAERAGKRQNRKLYLVPKPGCEDLPSPSAH